VFMCASLVAFAYQSIGVLPLPPQGPLPNNTWPCDFSAGGKIRLTHTPFVRNLGVVTAPFHTLQNSSVRRVRTNPVTLNPPSRSYTISPGGRFSGTRSNRIRNLTFGSIIIQRVPLWRNRNALQATGETTSQRGQFSLKPQC
jgi:hypothetical protein